MCKHRSSFVSHPGVKPGEVNPGEKPILHATGDLCPDCGEPMVDDYRIGGSGRLVDPFCQTPECAAKKRKWRGVG